MTRPDFSLYILRCADGSLYTGIATDVQKRLAEHEGGPRGAKYLRGRGPFEIVYSSVVGGRAVAAPIGVPVYQHSRAAKHVQIEGGGPLGALGGGVF